MKDKKCVIAFLALTILMYNVKVYGQYAHAQVTTPEQPIELCTLHNTELLKIISLDFPCLKGNVIEHWLSAGYKIVSATNEMVFMTK